MSLTWHQGFFAVLKSSSTKALQVHHQSAILRRLRYKSAFLREKFNMHSRFLIPFVLLLRLIGSTAKLRRIL